MHGKVKAKLNQSKYSSFIAGSSHNNKCRKNKKQNSINEIIIPFIYILREPILGINLFLNLVLKLRSWCCCGS